MIRRDVIVAASVVVFGAAVMYEASKLSYGAVRNPGPGFFPWWLSLVLTALAVVMGAVAFTNPTPDERGAGRPLKVWALLAVLAVYVGALDRLGYVVCTFLVVVFMLRVLEPRRWPLALGVAGLASGGSYVLFDLWLKVPLPPGVLAR